MPFIFDNAKPEQPQDTVQTTQKGPSDEWLDSVRLTASRPQLASREDGAMSVHPGIGNIRSIELPESPSKTLKGQPPGFHGYSMTTYVFGANPETASSMTFMYNISGSDRDPSVAAAVRKLLSEPNHELSASEIQKIGPALEDTNQNPYEPGDDPGGNYFDIKFAQTKTIDDERILLVGGQRNGVGADGKETDYEVAAYIDSDPKRPGWLPESVIYACPASGDPVEHQHRVQTAINAFGSMKLSPPS